MNYYEKIANIKTPIYRPGDDEEDLNKSNFESEILKNAKKVSSNYANIIVKEDKINHGLYSIVKELGITDNNKIQLLKRYLAYKESSAYAKGIQAGENEIKCSLKKLLGLQEDEGNDW